jgi:hypothetical protein
VTACSEDPRQQICRTLDEPIAPRPAAEFRLCNLSTACWRLSKKTGSSAFQPCDRAPSFCRHRYTETVVSDRNTLGGLHNPRSLILERLQVVDFKVRDGRVVDGARLGSLEASDTANASHRHLDRQPRCRYHQLPTLPLSYPSISGNPAGLIFPPSNCSRHADPLSAQRNAEPSPQCLHEPGRFWSTHENLGGCPHDV